MQEFISNSIKETEKIARDLAMDLKGGELLALSGNLGTGKTFFVKVLAKALGVKGNITSPTFILMKIYDVNKRDIKKLVHVDCYRLSNKEDLIDVGLEDYLYNNDTVVVIEWADKIVNLPKSAIKINIDYISDTKRRITIKE